MEGYSEEEENSLFEGIYSGVIDLKNLPKKLFRLTVDKLTLAINEGYGNIDPLLREFQDNIYIFSGAKTATQVMDINSLLTDGDRVVPLSEFKKKAKARFETYNTAYLETEYVTAHTTASSAANYKKALADKELFPMLTSHAIIDEFTAPECERMNKVTAPVDHPIWNHNLAARHFNCRCYETKEDRFSNVKETEGLNEIIKANEKDLSPLFKFNPVKDKIIFSDEHPYYDIGKRYPKLAKKNFGL